MKKIKLRKSSMRLDSLDTTKKLYESDDYKNNLKDKFWDEELFHEALGQFLEGNYGDIPEYIRLANDKYINNKPDGDRVVGIYKSPLENAKSPDTDLCIMYSKKDDAIFIMSANEYLLKGDSRNIEAAAKTLKKMERGIPEEEQKGNIPEPQTKFLNRNTPILEGYDYKNTLKDGIWKESDVKLALDKFFRGDYGKVSTDIAKRNKDRIRKQYGDIVGIYTIGNEPMIDNLIIYFKQDDNHIYLLSRDDFAEFKEYWLLGGYKSRGTSAMETSEEYTSELNTNPVLKKYLGGLIRPGELLEIKVKEDIDAVKDKLNNIKNKISSDPEISAKEKEIVINYIDKVLAAKDTELNIFKQLGTSYDEPGMKLNKVQREELNKLWEPERTSGKIKEENSNLDELSKFASSFINQYNSAVESMKDTFDDKVREYAVKFAGKHKNGLIGSLVKILSGIVKRGELKFDKEGKVVYDKDEEGNNILPERRIWPKEKEEIIDILARVDNKIARNKKELEEIPTYTMGANQSGVVTKGQINAIKNFVENKDKIKEANAKYIEKANEKSKKSDKPIQPDLIPEDIEEQLKTIAADKKVSYYDLLEKLAEYQYIKNFNFVTAYKTMMENIDKPYYLTEDSKPVKDGVKYVVYLNGEPYVTCNTEDEAYAVESQLYSASNTEEDFQSYYGSYPDVEIKKIRVADSKVNDFEYYHKEKHPRGEGWKRIERRAPEEERTIGTKGKTMHRQKYNWERPNQIFENWRLTDIKFDVDSTDIDTISADKPGEDKSKIKSYSGRIMIFGENYFVNNNSVIVKTSDFFKFKYDTKTGKVTIFGWTDAFPEEDRIKIEKEASAAFREQHLHKQVKDPKSVGTQSVGRKENEVLKAKYVPLSELGAKAFFKTFNVDKIVKINEGETITDKIKSRLLARDFDVSQYAKVITIDENNRASIEYLSDVLDEIKSDDSFRLVRLNPDDHYAVINDNGNKIEFVSMSEKSNYFDKYNRPIYIPTEEEFEAAEYTKNLAPESSTNDDEKKLNKFLNRFDEQTQADILDALEMMQLTTPTEMLKVLIGYKDEKDPDRLVQSLRKTALAKLVPSNKTAVESSIAKGRPLPEGNFLTKKKQSQFNRTDVTNEFAELAQLKHEADFDKSGKTKEIFLTELENFKNLFDATNPMYEVVIDGQTFTGYNTDFKNLLDILALDYPDNIHKLKSFVILTEIKEDENQSNSNLSDSKKRKSKDGFNNEEYKEFIALCEKLNLLTMGDVKRFSENHGNVKDKELLAAMRLAAEKLVTDAADLNSNIMKNALLEVKSIVNNPELKNKFDISFKRIHHDTSYLIITVTDYTTFEINFRCTYNTYDGNIDFGHIYSIRIWIYGQGTKTVSPEYFARLYNGILKAHQPIIELLEKLIADFVLNNESNSNRLEQYIEEDNQYKAELKELASQLNLKTNSDIIWFSNFHGQVKGKELLKAMRNEITKNSNNQSNTAPVIDAADNTKYYLYYIPYNQVDGKKIYYVGRGKMTYVFKSEDSGYKPKEVTFDDAVKIAKQFKQQESAKLYLEDITSKETISITDEVPAKYRLCFEGEDTYDMFDESDIEEIYLDKLPEDNNQEAIIKSKLKEVAKKIYQQRQGKVNTDTYQIEFSDVYITENGKYVQSILENYLPLKISLKKGGN